MSSDNEIEPAIKPPYLGLLNAISIAERNAGRYLKAWADVTPDPDLRRALSLVAARETTHGDVFRQRIERLGFSLLDKDDDLWLCNANEEGAVYANVLLEGDLLAGEGGELVVDQSGRIAGPAERAERLCAAVGSYMEDLEIVATVDDAMGDYLVWLKNSNDAYWMCNASADAKLYTFEAVQYPVDEAIEADDPVCCETEEDRQS